MRFTTKLGSSMITRRSLLKIGALTGLDMLTVSIASATDPFIFNEYAAFPDKGWNNLRGKTETSSVFASPSTTKTIIIGGQSLMATANGTSTYTTVSSLANQLNIYDGGIYLGSDPVLGCSYTPSVGVSSIGMRTADSMISRGKATQCIVVPIAIADTPYAVWTPSATGTLFGRITTAILRCRARGLEPDAFMWGEGEKDSSIGTSAASITASIQEIAAGIRAAPISCTAPFYVGLYSMTNGSTNATVRTGISNSVSAPLNIVLGYDADTNLTVAGGFRLGDNTHLSNTGLATGATGWTTLMFP